MNLGQSMLVIGAILLLGILTLNANRTVMETNDVTNSSEFGIAAVSLATSLVEEAMGKMFDEVVADTVPPTMALSILSTSLQKESGERYRGGTNDFDDFDDYNNLFVVYTSPNDMSAVAGADTILVVPGLRARYYVRARVNYVNSTALDDTSSGRTWHKKLRVEVTSPRILPIGQAQDTLVYPAVMSYW